ncbi:hypothetical protein B484DRAFT_461182, partial [Ochromonadaceae sp. CCMP2298]
MKSTGRGSDQRGGRAGGRGRDQPRRFSNVRIIDRDFGKDKVMFEGGSASAFVLVEPLMVKREKSVGVFEFWTGELKKDFFMRAPFVIMHYDPNFVEPSIDVASQEGQHMLVRSRGVNPGSDSPGGTTYPQSLAPYPLYYTSNRRFVGDQDPVYQHRQDEEERTSGIRYGVVVVNTSDPEDFSEHVSKVQDRILKWYSTNNKHQGKQQLADSTLRGCIGAGPLGVIRSYLDAGELQDAWDTLHDRYGAGGNPWVIAKLDMHLSALKLSHPAKLAEYHNRLQTLIVALDSSGVHKSEAEIAAIQEASLMSTPYNRQIFESAFTNARQNDWPLQKLQAVLQRKSEAL